MNLRMHQGLAPRNGHYGCTALFGGAEAFFWREIFLKNMRRILDLPASSASQIASEERLQHQHQGIPFPASKLLPDHVSRYRPHLRNWYRQLIASSLLFFAHLHSFAICGKREEREVISVQMICEIENARKPCSRILRLIPRTISLLCAQEICDP